MFDTVFNLPVFISRFTTIWGTLMFVVHTCVCLFWLVKEASNSAVSADEDCDKI
jgi:hypothetical protein